MVVLSTPAQSEILSKLPDVRSRLAAGIFLSIPDPGDEVLTTILERHLLVHGIKLTSEDLQFFIHRLPRSPQDVIHAAELMKNIMFEQKMTAGKKLFHLVLEEIVS
jgi:chromosomal replication initiation ATPase DnaA